MTKRGRKSLEALYGLNSLDVLMIKDISRVTRRKASELAKYVSELRKNYKGDRNRVKVTNYCRVRDEYFIILESGEIVTSKDVPKVGEFFDKALGLCLTENEFEYAPWVYAVWKKVGKADRNCVKVLLGAIIPDERLSDMDWLRMIALGVSEWRKKPLRENVKYQITDPPSIYISPYSPDFVILSYFVNDILEELKKKENPFEHEIFGFTFLELAERYFLMERLKGKN